MQNYNRDQKTEYWKDLVETAIRRYTEDINDSVAGSSILRYASAGLIGTNGDPNEFISWYPLHQGYIILRQAREGKLYYKECTS